MDRSAQLRVAVDKTGHVVGTEKFAADEFLRMTCRFTPRRIRVHRGSSVTWNNTTTDGHTLSVVTHDQLPGTIQQVDNRGVCNDLIAAHFPNGFPPRGAPVLVLDDFKASSAPARFDSVGDSVIVAPPGVGLPTSVSVVISALPGTTLDDMCAVHPRMQGSIHVVGLGDSTKD